MIRMIKVLCILVMFCFIGTTAYGFIHEQLNECELKVDLEKKYGINILDAGNEDNINADSLMILEQALKKFPAGLIGEITEFYSNRGINTNVIIDKTETISDLFSEYKLDEKSADLYIYMMQNSIYHDACVASEEGFIYEIGQYIRDYLLEVYGCDKLKAEFERMNGECKYGTWGNGYENVFINKHSAMSFNDEIADIILFSETHPEILRNINNGNYTAIHKKIEYLASIIDCKLLSVTSDTKLWQDALPQKPDEWALDAVNAMKESSLIPEELDGIYNSYITKGDFCLITLNLIEKKVGKDELNKLFGLVKQEEYVAIDPIKGEVYIDNEIGNINSYEDNCNDMGKRMAEAYQICFIDGENQINSSEYITRLEMAKVLFYLGNKLGMDVSDYEDVVYDDISDVAESEKPIIYFSASKGLLKGDGTSLKPYNYCTYQEAYMMLMRFYNLL